MFRRILLLGLLACATQADASVGFAPYVTRPTGVGADTLLVTDITRDGRDDVVLVSRCDLNCFETQRLLVYVQQPDGRLAEPMKYSLFDIPAYRTGLALGDMDEDGHDDVVVGTWYGATIFSYSTVPTPRFKISQIRVYDISETPGEDVGIMDVDRDGHLDVIAQKWRPGAKIFYGNGKGGSSRVGYLNTNAAGYNDLKIADVNHDGYPDMLVSSGQGDWRATLSVHYHDGIGGFPVLPEVFNPGYHPGSIGIGDFNHDGLTDAATSFWLSNAPSKVSVFEQQPTGRFGAPIDRVSTDTPRALLGGDLDGDGLDDLVVAHDGWNKLGVYWQDENGLGGTEQLYSIDYPAGITWSVGAIGMGDLNGDGCKDLALADYYGGLGLLYGTGCAPTTALPDLGVGLARAADAVVVGFANIPGATSIHAPLVGIDLSVRAGTLQIGALPEECVLQTQSTRSARIECLLADIAPGADTTLRIPFVASGTPSRNTLTVTASAATSTPEARTDNNRITQYFVVGSTTKRVQGLQKTSGKRSGL